MGGVDYPRTFQEFREWFPDDAACVAYLETLRWPAGFICPRCATVKGWRVKSGSWMCSSCGLKTSATAGTIFHRSHTPISTWFAAAWFITSSKTGISALALQRQFGFGSYETAWAWMQKLRRAMVRPERELNRPGLCGGSDSAKDDDHASIEEVSAGVAGPGHAARL